MRHAGMGVWSGVTERETAQHALQRRRKRGASACKTLKLKIIPAIESSVIMYVSSQAQLVDGFQVRF